MQRLAAKDASSGTRRRGEQYMPLVAFCLRQFLAEFIICMCAFDFRKAHAGLPHRVTPHDAATHSEFEAITRLGVDIVAGKSLLIRASAPPHFAL